MKLLCLLPVLLVCGIVEVNSLQCYVCENCPSPTDADLSSCDEPVTTVTVQSTMSTASTTRSTTTTAAPATTTPGPATTTAAPATTTPAPATTTAAPATTTAPTTPAPVQTSAQDTDSNRRFKRSILSLANSTKAACNCKNEIGCDCDDNSNRISTYADYVCFKVVLKKDESIVRGCAPAMLDSKAPCELDDVVAIVNSCSTCDTDQCNSSYMTQSSVYILVTTLFVVLFK